jgi:anti-anti-sigma regulatory factor
VLDAGVRRLEIDLSGVREIDRAGVAALFVVYKRLRSDGGALQFSAVSAECEHAMRQRHLFNEELDLYHVRQDRRV